MEGQPRAKTDSRALAQTEGNLPREVGGELSPRLGGRVNDKSCNGGERLN